MHPPLPRRRTMRTAAHFISALLHPLFMPLYTLLVAWRMDVHLGYFVNAQVKWITVGMVLAMTVVFPLVSTLLMLRGGYISSLTVPQREERPQVFIMALFYFVLMYYLVRKLPHHPATLALLFGGVLAVALALVITLYWKISAHLVGMGGLLGALGGLLVLHGTFAPVEMAFFIVLAGALGTARILLGAHDAPQVYGGCAVGFLSTFGCVVWGIAP
jgi:hypothetical protein